MSAKNAVCSWDFTCPYSYEIESLKTGLNELCKKWVFQLEEGEGGYKHYQGRIKLKVKARNLMGKIDKVIHWSVTSTTNSDNDFYITKEETRLEGPWRNNDEVLYIPRQIREIDKLYPWQQQIVDDAENWDTRNINIIWDTEGNVGKSILAGWIRSYKIGRVLPPVNDSKDLLRMVYGVGPSRLYVFDMPRSMNKDRLYGFYSAIETIKDGYCYDDRYEFKERVFDCPNVWIFTNTYPNINFLSKDRWKIWSIHQGKLITVELDP